MSSVRKERHRTLRSGWLRAAVLGANDGIISTASLVLGVAAAHGSHAGILVAGTAGLAAGAMSMAAGEYVSVCSQLDIENADLKLERAEHRADSEGELSELASIYVHRGLDPALAGRVAEQLTAHDPIGAHARDELGITETLRARPIQAALASAASFGLGAAIPLGAAIAAPAYGTMVVVAALSFLSLALLGAAAAQVGGANRTIGAGRVAFWGALAMAVTAGIGRLFGELQPG